MGEEKKQTSKVVVPSTDPDTTEKEEHDRKKEAFQHEKDLLTKKDSLLTTTELSAEDTKLKELLDGLTQQLIAGPDRAKPLAELCEQVKGSTSSMTSIPKPLKFLRPHYNDIKALYHSLDMSAESSKDLSDLISVLAMTMSSDDSTEVLDYCLTGHPSSKLTQWGQEYVRSLCGQIGATWTRRIANNQAVTDLERLVTIIVPHLLQTNSDFEAIDLLIEVEQLEQTMQCFTQDNFERVGQYALALAELLPLLEEQVALRKVVYQAYVKYNEPCLAMRVAMKLDDKKLMSELIEANEDHPEIKTQMGYMLGDARIFLTEFEDDDEFSELMGNAQLSAQFITLGSELDVKAVKSPEDIYKSHLAEGHARRRPDDKKTQPTHDSAKDNLASTFVNAFVNCGFQTDALLTTPKSEWVYHNRESGMLSAAASHGLIALWDVETGFNSLDIYSRSVQGNIIAGGLLGSGILACGVTSEMDAAFTLLSTPLEEDAENVDVITKTAAIIGLGLAYVSSQRDDVLELLVPLIVDDSEPLSIASMTCLALGLVFNHSAHEDVSGSMLEAFLDRSEKELNSAYGRLMCVGMGLLFLNSPSEALDTALLATSAVPGESTKKYLEITLRSCAYAGTGNMVEIQKMMSICTGKYGKEEEEAAMKDSMLGMDQQVAVLGIALISLGEPLSKQMAFRCLDHIMQYGSIMSRRALPLALGLLSLGDPQLTVMDTLNKLAHDGDERVSQNALFALGLLGAGTNNSRIAQSLRQLAVFYGKEPSHLFLCRISQGLLHLGKGLLTLGVYSSDAFVLDTGALGGILTLCHAMLSAPETILKDEHWLLFLLTPAIRPRMLLTLQMPSEEEDEEPVACACSVRVGAKLDTVGQAGVPRTITGFQTHNTPVVLAYNDRAELNTEEFIPVSKVLEGRVLLTKNANYKGKEKE